MQNEKVVAVASTQANMVNTIGYLTMYRYPLNLRSEAYPQSFQIEFLFDSLTPCQVTIFQSVPDSVTMDMIANG